MNLDEKWMRIALEEANLAMKENEVPVGAVIVENDRLIARAHNQPIMNNDPTAHAEIQVIRKAGQEIKNYRLVGSTLYVTLEPCKMCLGAIINARINRIVFGASDSNKTQSILYKNLDEDACFRKQLIIQKGVLENECSEILQKFFRMLR